jgi:hypothetical protein
VPSHHRMRVFDRDLIRGGHYGQRSCETASEGRTHGCTDQACYVKKVLANPEPSTHGTSRQLVRCSGMSEVGSRSTVDGERSNRRDCPDSDIGQFVCERPIPSLLVYAVFKGDLARRQNQPKGYPRSCPLLTR